MASQHLNKPTQRNFSAQQKSQKSSVKKIAKVTDFLEVVPTKNEENLEKPRLSVPEKGLGRKKSVKNIDSNSKTKISQFVQKEEQFFDLLNMILHKNDISALDMTEVKRQWKKAIEPAV